jgi:hypothetical protein
VKKSNGACVLALFVLISSANASVVTFEFSGEVTQVPLDEVVGDLVSGNLIQGSFSFDTSAIDSIPGDPATGSFSWSAPFGMRVRIGAHDFSASAQLSIGILNSFVDQYSVLATSDSGDLTLELFFQDNTGNVFASDKLPLAPPPLAGFSQKDFHLDAISGDGETQADGELDSLSSPPVPEPSTSGLFLAGSILLALGRFGRTSSYE